MTTGGAELGFGLGFGLSVAPGGAPDADPGSDAPPPPVVSRRPPLDVEALAEGVLAGDRVAVGRAISLVESSSPRHAGASQDLLARLLPHTGGSVRVGITGVPGVGKSTFIETLGMRLVEGGKRVAVLAIDPSSVRSGGSILGDKTRMSRLAADERAFIRPSPSARTLGGVTKRTRETILVCEAAGHSVVLVETVGVGQSETAAAGMTDVFLALMLAGAGDELQGVKRGLLELVDVIAVNKADGDNEFPARRAVREYASAMRVLAGDRDGGPPPVLACSAMTGDGIGDVWRAVTKRVEALRSDGRLDERRRTQTLDWLDAMIRERVLERVGSDPAVAESRAAAEAAVMAGELTPAAAADHVLAAVLGREPGGQAGKRAER